MTGTASSNAGKVALISQLKAGRLISEVRMDKKMARMMTPRNITAALVSLIKLQDRKEYGRDQDYIQDI